MTAGSRGKLRSPGAGAGPSPPAPRRPSPQQQPQQPQPLTCPGRAPRGRPRAAAQVPRGGAERSGPRTAAAPGRAGPRGVQRCAGRAARHIASAGSSAPLPGAALQPVLPDGLAAAAAACRGSPAPSGSSTPCGLSVPGRAPGRGWASSLRPNK